MIINHKYKITKKSTYKILRARFIGGLQRVSVRCGGFGILSQAQGRWWYVGKGGGVVQPQVFGVANHILK